MRTGHFVALASICALCLSVGLVLAEEQTADEFSGNGGLSVTRWSVGPTDRGRFDQMGNGYVEALIGTEDAYEGMWWRPHAISKTALSEDDQWCEAVDFQPTGWAGLVLFLRVANLGHGLNGPSSAYYYATVNSDGGTKSGMIAKHDGAEGYTTIATQVLPADYFSGRRSVLFEVRGTTLRLRDKEGVLDLTVEDSSISEGLYSGVRPQWKESTVSSAKLSRWAAGVGLAPTGYGDDYEPLPDDWEVPEDSSMFADPDMWLLYEELRKARYYEDRGELMIYDKLKELRVDLSDIQDDTARIVEIMEGVEADTSMTEMNTARGDWTEEAIGNALAYGDSPADGFFDGLYDGQFGPGSVAPHVGFQGSGDIPSFGVYLNDSRFDDIWTMAIWAMKGFMLLWLVMGGWRAVLYAFGG
jgi:hypothetical protein